MKLGYARVSTEDQRLDLQRARLKEAGCGRVFEEKISGAARQRPALERLLQELRADDILVVSRLDRLARSTAELLRIAEVIREKDAGLQSLEEPWADTTTPAGRMVLTMFAGVAEFERALIRHRTDEGRQAAKRRGVSFGRPQKLRPDQKTLALSLGRVDGFDDDEAQSECDEGSEVPVRFLATERNALEALELADEVFDAGAGAIERLREERRPVLGR